MSILKNGLPKTEFLRLRRLCHSDKDYTEKSLEIKRFHSFRFRSVLLTKSIHKEKPFSVTCISTCTCQAHAFKNNILKYWHVLISDPALTQHFKDPPLFVYKRGPNQQNKLVRASIHHNPRQTLQAPLKQGNYPFGNCAQCHKIYIGNNINYPVARQFNNHSYPISSLRFQGIEQVTLQRGADVDRRLCQRELYWIHNLETPQPLSLNKDLEMGAAL